MSNRYLVTGGAGFIGSHLCDALLARGDEVVALDNFVSGPRDNLRSGRDGLQVVHGDVRNVEQYADEIGEVDAVVHLASLISGYDSLAAPNEYINVNVHGLLRLIEFVAARHISRIVFASSSTVYGNSTAPVLDEAAYPNPLTVYALSKLASEHLLGMYGQLHGFSHCSLRLFNVYGPRQAVHHPYANVTCKFAHAAAHGRGVKLYGDGDQSRDFVFVDDVVDAFCLVLNSSRHTVYNVGTGRETSINDLLEQLRSITGHSIPTEQHEAWPNDIRTIRADIGRLKGEFGFSPQTSIREGLLTTVNHFLHAMKSS